MENAALRYTRFGLMGLFVLTTFALFPFTDDPVNPIKWLLLSYGVLGLHLVLFVAAWFSDDAPPGTGLVAKLFAVLVALLLFSSVLSSFPLKSLVETGHFVILALLFLVASRVVTNTRYFQTVLSVCCATVALSCVYGFFQRFGWDPIPWSYTVLNRQDFSVGTFGHPNFAGHAAVLCIPAAIYLVVTGRRILGVIFATIYLLHLLAVGYRAGMVALFAVGALFFSARVVYRLRLHPRSKVAAVMLATFCLCLLAACVVALGFYLKTRHPYPGDTSVLLRLNGYQNATTMIRQRPLRGYGTGIFEIETPRFWTPFEQDWFAQKHEMNKHVHNEPLEFAVDAGIPAAAVYLFLLGYVVFEGLLALFSSEEKEKRLLGLFFASFFTIFAVDGMFGFNIRVPVSASLFSIVLGGFQSLFKKDKSASILSSKVSRIYTLGWYWVGIVLLIGTVFFESRSFAADMWFFVGRTAAEANKKEKPVIAFSQGEQLAPWRWDFPAELGKLAAKQEKYDVAISCFSRALRRNPNHLESLLNYSSLLLRRYMELRGQSSEGLRLLDEANHVAAYAYNLCPSLPQARDLLSKIDAVKRQQDLSPP